MPFEKNEEPEAEDSMEGEDCEPSQTEESPSIENEEEARGEEEKDRFENESEDYKRGYEDGYSDGLVEGMTPYEEPETVVEFAEGIEPIEKLSLDLIKIKIDSVEDILYSCNMDGNNYVMLRDLAYVLSESEKSFAIDFKKMENGKSGIFLTSKTKQNIHVEDLPDVDLYNIRISKNKYPIYVDAKPVDVKSYSINGATYVNLRDLAPSLGLTVEYDKEDKAVIIKTK